MLLKYNVSVLTLINVCNLSETFAYCKRSYFRWRKISRKCWQDISRGGNFHDTAPISFIEAYGFYFRVGVIFAMNKKALKTRKLPPRENFHVYSMQLITIDFRTYVSKYHSFLCYRKSLTYTIHDIY